MPYNYKLFMLLSLIIKNYISYWKQYNNMQTNDYYQIEIITWNHIIE